MPHQWLDGQRLQVVQTAEAVSAGQATRLVPGLGRRRIGSAAEWRPARRGRNAESDKALEALGEPPTPVPRFCCAMPC